VTSVTVIFTKSTQDKPLPKLGRSIDHLLEFMASAISSFLGIRIIKTGINETLIISSPYRTKKISKKIKPPVVLL